VSSPDSSFLISCRDGNLSGVANSPVFEETWPEILANLDNIYYDLHYHRIIFFGFFGTQLERVLHSSGRRRFLLISNYIVRSINLGVWGKVRTVQRD